MNQKCVRLEASPARLSFSFSFFNEEREFQTSENEITLKFIVNKWYSQDWILDIFLLYYIVSRIWNLLEIYAVIDTLEGKKEVKDTKSSLKKLTIITWKWNKFVFIPENVFWTFSTFDSLRI